MSSDDALLVLDTSIQDLRRAIVAMKQVTQLEIAAIERLCAEQVQMNDAITDVIGTMVALLAARAPFVPHAFTPTIRGGVWECEVCGQGDAHSIHSLDLREPPATEHYGYPLEPPS